MTWAALERRSAPLHPGSSATPGLALASRQTQGSDWRPSERSCKPRLPTRGWSDVIWIEDAGISAKTLDRPGMRRALELLAANDAGVLAVAKLDRLSRSVVDGAGLMARAQREGWAIVALDLGVDTGTPAGKMVANVLMSIGEWEREIISERTRDGLAAKRAQGVRLGRPVALDDAVVGRIRAERDPGATLTTIAASLTADGVPTAHGGARWYPSTVAAVLARA